MTVDPERLLLTKHAEATGRTPRTVSRQVGKEQLARVRRGVAIDRADWESLEAIERFRYRLHALAATLARPVVFSHWAAAVLLDLPARVEDGTRIDVTVEAGTNRALVGARAHALALEDADVQLVDGLLCTTPARTAVDLACAAPFREAVVVTDAVLHRFRPEEQGTAHAELEEAWERARPRRAVRKVREVLDFADGGSGSVGESHSRVSMRALGLPRPVLQHRFFDGRGFAGQTDFWFPEQGVIGETDGKVTFTDPAMTGGDPGLVFWNEKTREDRLRAIHEVEGFARWGFPVACSPRLLGPRLAAAGVRPLPH